MTPGAAGPRGKRTFAALAVRNYRIYFVGQFISVVGSWAQNLAMPWLILLLSHSGLVLGLTSIARYAPVVLLGPWGGLVADRYDRRTILRISQVLSGLNSAAVALLILTDAVNIWLLLPLMVMQGVISAGSSPARQSIISEIVPRAILPNAIALNSALMNTARIIGPALAGVLIAVVGIQMCFWINAASYLAVIASLSMLDESEMHITASAERRRGQILEGFRYVAKSPVLFYSVVMFTVTGVLTWEFPITMPMIATDTFHGNASTLGTLMSALGAGAVVGGFLGAMRTRITIRALTISAALWGIAIIVAALAPSEHAAIPLLVVVGIGSVTFNSQAKTLLQLSAAPEMRGRVMALWSTSWQGSTLLGAPIMGAIGEFASPRWALATGGLAAIISGGVYYAACALEDGASVTHDFAREPQAAPDASPDAAPDATDPIP